jgi:hypothetical protein
MCVLALLLQDVLGHLHTKAFVSHCGVHSINEAAYHGVPVVAVPIQFEQVRRVLLCSHPCCPVLFPAFFAHLRACLPGDACGACLMPATRPGLPLGPSRQRQPQGSLESHSRHAGRRQRPTRALRRNAIAGTLMHAGVSVCLTPACLPVPAARLSMPCGCARGVLGSSALRRLRIGKQPATLSTTQQRASGP